MANKNPKDGWKALVVAICASVLQAVVLGINNSFPNFIRDMLADDELNTDNSRLALVQACSLGIAGVLAVPAGFCVQRFGSRIASFIASFAVIVCMVITSVGANSGASMIGLYSVPMGIGVAFMMSPGATATSSWFEKRAALGMGICFTGGGTGSLSIPRIAGALSKSFSWRTSFLILAAIGALGVVASFFICIRPTDGDDEDEQAAVAEGGGVRDPDSVEEGRRAAELQELGGESAPMRLVPNEVLVARASQQSGPTALAVHEEQAMVRKAFNYHTDKADIRNLLFNCIFTRNFLGLFFCYSFFSLGFYSLLYICVPYANAMGAGVYVKASRITVDEASNVFVPFGIMEAVGGPVLGYMATRTDERLVFIAAMGLLALTSGYYAIARTLAEHLGLFILFGFGCVAFFSTFGTMIAQRFHGPNLSVLMSSGFSGSAIGGFLGSTVSIEIVNAQNGDYTYVTTLISLMFFFSGLVVMFVVQDVGDSDTAQQRRIRRDEKRMGGIRSTDGTREEMITNAVVAAKDSRRNMRTAEALNVFSPDASASAAQPEPVTAAAFPAPAPSASFEEEANGGMAQLPNLVDSPT